MPGTLAYISPERLAGERRDRGGGRLGRRRDAVGGARGTASVLARLDARDRARDRGRARGRSASSGPTCRSGSCASSIARSRTNPAQAAVRARARRRAARRAPPDRRPQRAPASGFSARRRARSARHRRPRGRSSPAGRPRRCRSIRTRGRCCSRWPPFAATLLRERTGIALALAVPMLPLGNISLGLALLYTALAAGWLLVTWREPRAALLFALGPLLAPIAARRPSPARRGSHPHGSARARSASRSACSPPRSSRESDTRRCLSSAARRRSGSASPAHATRSPSRARSRVRPAHTRRSSLETCASRARRRRPPVRASTAAAGAPPRSAQGCSCSPSRPSRAPPRFPCSWQRGRLPRPRRFARLPWGYPPPQADGAAGNRAEAGAGLRRSFRPRLPHQRPAGRARAQACEGDGRAPLDIGHARLRSERVHDLPLCRRPRAVRGLRELARLGVGGVPRRARLARELRAAHAAADPVRDRRRPRRRRVRHRHAHGAARPTADDEEAPAGGSAARRDDDLQAAHPADRGRLARGASASSGRSPC